MTLQEQIQQGRLDGLHKHITSHAPKSSVIVHCWTITDDYGRLPSRPNATDYDRLRPITDVGNDKAGIGSASDEYRIGIGSVSDSIGLTSHQQSRVIQHLADHAKATSKDIEALLGVKEARARRLLKQMVEKKLIVKLGRARNTYYELAKNLGGRDE